MSASRVLRSRTPELVRQEIWALLLTHYAVREFMHEAAESADEDDGLDVDELSFVRSLNAVRRQVTNQAGFPPHRLKKANTETLEEIRSRRAGGRRNRSYPRVVKRKHVGAKRLKRGGHTGTRYTTPPKLRVIRRSA
jgi:hypothetical protein